MVEVKIKMSMSLEVCTDGKEWDRLLESAIQGSIFHKWDFLQIMGKHSLKRIAGRELKARLYPLVAYKGDEPVGLYPFYVYDFFSVKFVSSPPEHVESLYLGPVLLDTDQTKPGKKEKNLIDLQKEADHFIHKNIKPVATVLNIHPGISDSRPFKWTGHAVEPRHGYLLDMASGTDAVWKGLHTGLRRKISKALGDGISVEEGAARDLASIHQSLAQRRAEQGMAMTSSLDYLQDVCKTFGGNVDIRIASKDGKYLGGIVNLLYKDTAHSWVGSAKTSNETGANELINWESMKYACEKKYLYYAIMGADSPNLYPFKAQYNGRLITNLSCRKYQPGFLKVVETAYKAFKRD